MVTTDDIREKRRELEILEDQYIKNTPPCMNEDCTWWDNGQTGNCNWSVLLEDCREYESEGTEEDE